MTFGAFLIIKRAAFSSSSIMIVCLVDRHLQLSTRFSIIILEAYDGLELFRERGVAAKMMTVSWHSNWTMRPPQVMMVIFVFMTVVS